MRRWGGGRRPLEIVDGVALVKFKPGTARAARAEALAAGGVAVENELYGWSVVRLPAGMSVEAALAFFAARPDVEAAAPNHVLRPLRLPNDPDFSSQYALSRINAPGAWEYEVGASTRVTVAVVDTGVDGTHPDLTANLFAPGLGLHRKFDQTTGASSAEAGGTPIDLCGHGTRVAGDAAADTDDALGVAGVSWRAKLLSLRVFTSDCNTGTSDAAIANAINYAVTEATTGNPSQIGRLVINISLGAAQPACDPLTTAAIQSAQAAGILVVAAAGNYDPSNNPDREVTCPAKVAGVIAVGATDQDDNPASFTALGSQVTLSAPGVSVLSTVNGGIYGEDSGTSFASPIVAGLAALLWSAVPAMSSATLAGVLTRSADALGDPTLYGAGRVNAFRAMRLATKGTLSTFAGEAKAIAFPSPADFKNGSVSFALPPSASVPGLKIKVFTQSGELVKTLPGLAWDGKNESGLPVASGVYIFLATDGDTVRARGRLAVLR